MKKPALALLPLALGLILMSAWQASRRLLPILYLRVDLGTLCLLVGLAFSALAAFGLVAGTYNHRHAAKAIARQRVEQSDLHRQFIRRLDHEMKNPLTALRAALANLNGWENGAVIGSLHDQVDRLARLTADLRKLTDLETQPIEREPVDVGQLLSELVLLAREQPESAGRQLHLTLPQVPWPLPSIAGDRELLDLACHNLLSNALKFSGPCAVIEVRAFEDGPSVVIEVADTGSGVDSEELPHLGEELYRGHSALGIEGSGLGLALVRAIAARHGGSVAIRSRLGQGTVARLRFPVAR